MSSPEARFRQLHEVLRDSHRTGARHVLLIEEAHCLPVPTLKHLKRYLELKDGMKPLLSGASPEDEGLYVLHHQHWVEEMLRAIDKDRDAVEAFLPVPDRAVSQRFEIGSREAFVLRLDLLQAGNSGPCFFQPFQQARQPRHDTVDIVGGDFHARSDASKRRAGLT
jgi:hypothetical protein